MAEVQQSLGAAQLSQRCCSSQGILHASDWGSEYYTRMERAYFIYFFFEYVKVYSSDTLIEVH